MRGFLRCGELERVLVSCKALVFTNRKLIINNTTAPLTLSQFCGQAPPTFLKQDLSFHLVLLGSCPLAELQGHLKEVKGRQPPCDILLFAAGIHLLGQRVS